MSAASKMARSRRAVTVMVTSCPSPLTRAHATSTTRQVRRPAATEVDASRSIRRSLLPLPACWCSASPATHGDAWLPSLFPVLASRPPFISCYVRRCPHALVGIAARPGCIPSRTCGSSCAGARTRTSTRSQPSGRTSSGTCAGCRTYAATSPRPSPGDCRSWSGSTGSASSTRSCRTRRATTCADPRCPAESPTLGLGHLQFEALITTARLSANPNDFALVALLGLLGLRIFEACGASIGDLGEEHGHRVLRVRGKGGKVVLVPLPPAVARAIDRAVDGRADGPILRNTLGARMDRHSATRRLKHLAATAGVRMPRMHPHMLRHTFVTTMLDAGVSLRDVQIAARHADPRTTMRYDRARKNLDRHPNYILAAYMASVSRPGSSGERTN